MSRPQRQSTATNPAAALNDLLSDPYPTPSTTTTTTKTTTTTSSPSASSYHTIAGAAAAHLIKQHQQQLALQQQIQQQAIQDNAHTLPAKLRGGSGTITTAAAALNLKPQPTLPPSPPRKNGSSIRIGQSILSQLLAAHSPGRGDKGVHGNDSSLSSETHRPKEQQRRSILPVGWGLFSSSSSKSRTMQGPSLTTSSKHSPSPASSSTAAAAATTGAGGPLLPAQLLENPEPMDRLQPVLPSVWLESILSGLSRADLNTPPHYATLPRANWQDDQLQQQQQQQQGIFPGLGPRSKKDESKSKERPPSGRNSRPPTSSSSATGAGGAPSPSMASATLHPKAQTLHRKSSVCELALGDDARELFQQNRPKTLSSAVISSSIVPAKEELRRRGSSLRQRSLDSSVVLSSTGGSVKPVSEPSPEHRVSSRPVLTGSSTSSSSSSSSTTPAVVEASTPGTVKTTRGRFTIESSSALPSPSPRTRTLSCTSATALTTGEPLTSFSPTLPPSSALSPSSAAHQEQQRMMAARRMHRTPSISMSPSSPALSHSFPSSRSLHSANSSSSFPPSPRLSPSRDHVNSLGNGDNSSSNTTSSPISIPRASFSSASSSSSSSSSNAADGSSNGVGLGGGRSSHQRSQSSTSSLSRFSQVIIPPPASAASLQFASFSSIGSPSRSSAPSESNWSAASNGNGQVHVRPSSVPEKRPTNSSGSNGNGNNIRNLSIQIVEAADRTASRNSSHSSVRRVLDYEGEPTPVHPLDEDLAASADNVSSTTARTHQTMNRVHPTQDQDFVDSPGGSEGSSLGSRVGSLSNGSGGMYLPLPDRRASDNIPHQQKQQQQHLEGAGFGYYDRTSLGSFRPRSLSATNLDTVGGYGKNGSNPSLHQQLSWADRTAMQREGSAHSRSFDVGTPPTSSLSPHSYSSGGSTSTPESDIVMVKKSAKGRMFTVERQSSMPPPLSPTRSSRFIVVSSTEDMCLSSSGPGPGSSGLAFPHHSLH